MNEGEGRAMNRGKERKVGRQGCRVGRQKEKSGTKDFHWRIMINNNDS